MKENKTLTCINLLGGPGSGKSTTAAGIFYKAKTLLWNIEIVTEYAKDKVYDGFLGCLEDQIYVFGQQQRRIKRLVGSVDLAVTDSPILLSALYNRDLSNTFDTLVYECFDSYSNINFFINRTKPYIKIGRTQEEHEARELDQKLKGLLNKYAVPYYELDGDEHCVDKIIDIVGAYANKES